MLKCFARDFAHGGLTNSSKNSVKELCGEGRADTGETVCPGEQGRH